MNHQEQLQEFTERIKLELNNSGKNLSTEEKNSFFQWMKIEYKKYMMLSRENAIKTLNKLEKSYVDYIELIEVLRNNINEYGSLQCFYRASIDLCK